MWDRFYDFLWAYRVPKFQQITWPQFGGYVFLRDTEKIK